MYYWGRKPGSVCRFDPSFDDSALLVPCRCPTPVKVGDYDVRSVVAEGTRTCLVSNNDDLTCWGKLSAPPSVAVEELTRPKRIVRGICVAALRYKGDCAITQDGELRCWGQRTVGARSNDSYEPPGRLVPGLRAW